MVMNSRMMVAKIIVHVYNNSIDDMSVIVVSEWMHATARASVAASA